MRASDRYPLNAVGDLNTYQIFAGLDRELTAKSGRVGIVIPSGIATDDSNKKFFADLIENKSLTSLYDFENRDGIFPGVHRSYKFCILTIGGGGAASGGADFAFFLTNTSQLRERGRRFSLSPEDIALLNPNTRTCPIFRSKRDAEITKDIYRRVPVLIDESKGEAGNPWEISFLRMFDMANDSHLFRTRKELEDDGLALEGNVFVKGKEKHLPLYEAKMIHQLDHRWATYEGPKSRDVSENEKRDPEFVVMPRYWVSQIDVNARMPRTWKAGWLIGWRDICRSTDERTVISSFAPLAGAGDTFLLMFPDGVGASTAAMLLGNLDSFVLDYATRQKIGGTHLKYHVFKQIPVLPPSVFENSPCTLEIGTKLSEFMLSRMIELVCSSNDISPFARDCRWSSKPFFWNPFRRFQIRCELDAAFFHLYGISRDDVIFIMESFPIVKRKDEQKYGEYRTKRIILECYDAMAEAMKTGMPYQTILDPPPGPPVNGLPEWKPGQPKAKDWPTHVHPPKECGE